MYLCVILYNFRIEKLAGMRTSVKKMHVSTHTAGQLAAV